MTKTDKTPPKKLRAFQRFALFFFKRPKQTTFLFLALIFYGLLCFTTLMRREGFPAMNIPFAVGQGVYTVNDVEQVDQKLAKPVSEFLVKQKEVKSVSVTSQPNVAIFTVMYRDGEDSEKLSKKLTKSIVQSKIAPESVKFVIEAAKMGYTDKGDDAVLSLYDQSNPNIKTTSLAGEVDGVTKYLKDQKISGLAKIHPIEPVEANLNPMTGEKVTAQTKFDRYGYNKDGKPVFYHSVAIGLTAEKNSDALDFSNTLEKTVDKYNQQAKAKGSNLRLALSASYAPLINQQMSELQRTLLEGLLAVLVIGSLIIAFRASFITVIAMLVTVVITFGVLHLFGYTLNTIVLFTLILGLALIVDDTIIMVEAIDRRRRFSQDPKTIISESVGKVGRAMLAATTTAALSFVPLLFVGGVIGEFVRAVPITIITALYVSLLVALIVIPLLSRYILLAKKRKNSTATGESTAPKKNTRAKIEKSITDFLSRPILWAKGVRRRQWLVGSLAILVTIGFLAAGALIATRVRFNIFPPTKDTNRIIVTLNFANGSTIEQAENYTDESIRRINKTVGANLESLANFGYGNSTGAYVDVTLIDYSKRSVTAPDLVKQIEAGLSGQENVQASAETIDIGPMQSNFEARILTNGDRAKADKLAGDIATYLKQADLKRIDGTDVKFETIYVTDKTEILRSGGKAYVGVVASFVDDDTSNLINLTKAAVEKEFPSDKVASYGLDKAALTFDFGQEDENQNSFNAMIIAFPILLVAIYIVLLIEFRSFLQPLIIFMAIPFSFFGIALGLWLTNNQFSFFAMLGFFALIGLSIKNTILLTDFANQARRAGRSAAEAAHDALAERFRPLIATSLTAVVSLVPLAIASPFWQGLTVVLIFGLLSSTLLVITVFPYFYLGAEFLRQAVKRRNR